MADLPGAKKKRTSPRARVGAFALFALFAVCAFLLVDSRVATDSHEPVYISQMESTKVSISSPVATSNGGLATSRETPPAVSPTPPHATVASVAGSPVPSAPVAPGAPAPTVVGTAASPSRITRLLIPVIKVDAPVEVKGLDGNGVMQAPDAPGVVAWYDFSAKPNGQGNAVFAGHLDYVGVGPAVFWRLAQLQSGDRIEVTEQNGRVFHYQVTSVRSYSATIDATQVVASTDTPTITLITCGGSFNRKTQEYSQRIVVTGKQVA